MIPHTEINLKQLKGLNANQIIKYLAENTAEHSVTSISAIYFLNLKGFAYQSQ